MTGWVAGLISSVETSDCGCRAPREQHAQHHQGADAVYAAPREITRSAAPTTGGLAQKKLRLLLARSLNFFSVSLA